MTQPPLNISDFHCELERHWELNEDPTTFGLSTNPTKQASFHLGSEMKDVTRDTMTC